MTLPTLLFETTAERQQSGLILDETEWIVLMDDIFTEDRTVIVIGKPGSGKTAWALRAAELADKMFGRQVAVLNLWGTPYETYQDPQALPRGSFVIVDEAELVAHSRRALSRSNVFLSQLNSIRRHKGLTIVFVTQATNYIDRALLQLADYIICKEPGALAVAGERSHVVGLVNYAKFWFASLPESKRRQHFVTFSDRFYTWLLNRYSYYAAFYGRQTLQWMVAQQAIIRGRNALPSFWSKSISEAFSDWGDSRSVRLRDERETRILNIARENGGIVSTAEVAKALKVTKPVASRLLGRLVRKGFLKRVKNGIYRLP